MAVPSLHVERSTESLEDGDFIRLHMDSLYFSGEERKTPERAEEIFNRVNLDLACSTKKLSNLNTLLKQVVDRAGDIEAVIIDDEFFYGDSAVKVLEFDISLGILYSETINLDDFLSYLHEELIIASASFEHMKDTFVGIEQKLLGSKVSLKHLQEQVTDQSSKLQNSSLHGLTYWNSGVSKMSHFPSLHHADSRMHDSEEQSRILKMLEKSLARELDLEKWLLESRHYEEELKLKLYHAEEEMKEMLDLYLERLFEAENFAEVMISISKEMTGKVQIMQLRLNGSVKRGDELQHKLNDSMQNLCHLNRELDALKVNLKKAEDDYDHVSSETFFYRDKENSLKERLLESENQLQNTMASFRENQAQKEFLNSKIIDLENYIDQLKKSVSEEKEKARNLESQCELLNEDNSKLRDEFNSLSKSEMEKVCLLEKQLKQAETQLKHAEVFIKASYDQRNKLDSAFGDMKKLEDLKEKALKAEFRAESAEAKAVLLNKTNSNLTEELSSLRDRVQYLEMSLHQADDFKMTIANNIGIKTKLISNLLLQLTVERERLKSQISTLTKENNFLVDKLGEMGNGTSLLVSHNANFSKTECFLVGDSTTLCLKSFEGLADDPATIYQAERTEKGIDTEVDPAASAEVSHTESMLSMAKLKKANQLHPKYFFFAVIMLLSSMGAVYLFHLDKCPF